MIELSILIPARTSAEPVAALLAEFEQTSLGGPRTEIVLVDDGLVPEQARRLESIASRHGALLLRLDPASGLSAALSAGIAAARGEVVVAIEASRQYPVEQVHRLLERLARADLVAGRRHRSRGAKLALALAQVPRRLLLGLEVRDPDCLFWAARREAVAGLELAAGMHRFLGSIVATRGYRVTEVHVDHIPREAPPRDCDGWPSLGNLLAVWWHRRGWRACQITQVSDAAETRGLLRVDPGGTSVGQDEAGRPPREQKAA